MIDSEQRTDLTTSLKKWRVLTPDRLKLQHIYLVLGIVSVLVAGLVGLINYSTGQRIVIVGLLSLTVYVINALVWALTEGLLLIKIDRIEPVSSGTRKQPTKKSSLTKISKKK